MNKQKIIFLSILILILILLIISQTQQQIVSGKITKIKYGNNNIVLSINNTQEDLIIFTNKILPLKLQQTIIANGNTQEYKNKTQFIVDRIKCLTLLLPLY